MRFLHIYLIACYVSGFRLQFRSCIRFKISEIHSLEPVFSQGETKTKAPVKVYSLKELQNVMERGLRDIDVRGDTSGALNRTVPHPVVQAMLDRLELKSIPGNRTDGKKIAIAIEGGGMRGCVAAGMISAVTYLGLEDTVDVVYGSSAGALVGAYFVSRQVPQFGPSVYYDVLTTSGSAFLDPIMLLRSCGLGLLDLRVESLKSLFQDRIGKPVLNLDFLLGPVVHVLRPLDWAELWRRQQSGTQRLKVVCSGLLSKKAVVLSAEAGNFRSLEELCQCIKASMLLPGITGDVVRLKGHQLGSNLQDIQWPEFTSHFDSVLSAGSEPLADAQLFEPVPFRSALAEGSTHVLVFRTRPDGVRITNRMNVLEKMIISRFLGRKLGLRDLVRWMHTQMHKLLYAEDTLRLNAASREGADTEVESEFDEETAEARPDSDAGSGPETGPVSARYHYMCNVSGTDFSPAQGALSEAQLLCVALPNGTAEVGRMELSRPVIFNAVREGFAASYNVLVAHDPDRRGKGWEVARLVWPDSILSSAPSHLAPVHEQQRPVRDERARVGVGVGMEVEAVEPVEASLPGWVPALCPPYSRRRALVRGVGWIYRNLVNSTVSSTTAAADAAASTASSAVEPLNEKTLKEKVVDNINSR